MQVCVCVRCLMKTRHRRSSLPELRFELRLRLESCRRPKKKNGMTDNSKAAGVGERGRESGGESRVDSLTGVCVCEKLKRN